VHALCLELPVAQSGPSAPPAGQTWKLPRRRPPHRPARAPTRQQHRHAVLPARGSFRQHERSDVRPRELRNSRAPASRRSGWTRTA